MIAAGLVRAYGADKRDIVKYLFDRIDLYGIDIVVTSNPFLCMAVNKNDTEYIEKLLNRPDVVNATLRYAFEDAVRNNNINLVKRLLQVGNPGFHSLVYAVRYGYLDIFGLLIDLDYGDHFDIDHLFMSSIGCKQYHITDLLLRDDRIILEPSGKNFDFVIRAKCLKYTKILFEAYVQRVKPKIYSKRYSMCLHVAIAAGWTEGVQYFISKELQAKYNLNLERLKPNLLKLKTSTQVTKLLSLA